MTILEDIQTDLQQCMDVGEEDLLWFSNTLAGMDEKQDKEADIFLVKNAGEFIKYDLDAYPDETDSWRWYYYEIAAGAWPLEKLPDHVRDLAKKLYYDKKNNSPQTL